MCGAILGIAVVAIVIAAGGGPLLLGLFLVWAVIALIRKLAGSSRERPVHRPGVGFGPAPKAPTEYREHSGRPHAETHAQTWRAFVKEAQSAKNSGANVKLGKRSGFDLGIVGESFCQPELHWIMSQAGEKNRSERGDRVYFDAYLLPDPENPHSRSGKAVRVESERGQRIGHLSEADAPRYAAVFSTLHAAGRVGLCRAVAVRRKANVGVWLAIDHPAWLGTIADEVRAAPAPQPRRRKRAEVAAADQPF